MSFKDKYYFLSLPLAAWSLFLGLLLAVFLFPVVSTVYMDSFRINYYQGFLYLLAAAALYVVMKSSAVAEDARVTRSGVVALAIFLIYLIGWMATDTPAPFIDRFFMLLGAVFLYLLMVRVYRSSEDFILSLFQLKFLVVIATAVFFVIFIFYFQDPELKPSVKGHPPVYRHLRHFNYELFFIFPFLIFLLKDHLNNKVLLGCLFILSGLAIWTAGRGMMVALGASLFVIGLRLWRNPPYKLIFIVFLIASVSLLAVILSDNTYILYNTTARTIDGSSLNYISANRLAIWESSISGFLGLGSPWVKLFGFGPDAFVRMGVFPVGPTHPHNAPVQILLEFGFLGLLLFVLLMVVLVYRSVYLVLHSPDRVDWLVGSTVVGAIVFSLFDGIFYHASAITMLVILVSYLNHRFGKITRLSLPVDRY